MINRYGLLLAVGLVVVFVVLTTSGDQLFLSFCGGLITGCAATKVVQHWREQ